MLEYIESLGKKPSKENLNRVMKEIWRAQDILINYHYLLSQITPDEKTWSIPETEQVKKIYRQIEDEEELIAACREVLEKINKALVAKK
jgi:hypothetical protein